MAEVERPNIWGREPALILAAIQAGLALAVTFGVDLSNEQIGGILATSAAIFGVWTRSQVRPVAMEEAKLTPKQFEKLERPIDGQ